MMKHLYHGLVFVVSLLFLAAGCRQPGPVELQERNQEGQELDVLTSEGFSSSGLDPSESTSPHPPFPKNVAGRLLIEGIIVDGVMGRHEATIAHAIFFNQSSPIVVGRDTVAYQSRDVGNIFLDSFQLNKRDKRFVDARFGIDTLLGVEYFLTSGDRVGPAEFRYRGEKVYQWRATGSVLTGPFTLSITAAPTVRIVQPSSSLQINIMEDLRVSWEGGGNFIRLMISSIEERQRPKPIFHARIRTRRHEVIVPAKILQALPRNQQVFLLTLASETNATHTLAGFSNSLLLQTSSSHSMVMRVIR
jgi:hypothetical protein